MRGLPETIRGLLFDLDGVLTRTAVVHEAAWKETFDEYLRARAATRHEAFVEFTAADYDHFVDGKPRADGVRSFLESRSIALPDGDPDDPPTAPTVHGLGNRKNERLLERLATDGVDTYDGSVRFVREAHRVGMACAVVSSSANTHQVLDATGLTPLFSVVIDGVVASRDHLRGKPAPDTFLAAATALGVTPESAAVFEDALAGVEAGRAGHFGYVVGVDRVGQADDLSRHGADVVVTDLADLLDGDA